MRPRSIRTVVILILLTCAPTAHAQVADASFDGPHVFWHDSTKATVFYLCDSIITKREFEVSDSLRFHGFCADSAVRYAIAASAPVAEVAVFDDVPRVFAVSDLHGGYEAFATALIRAGLVDSSLRWVWGDGHLVINGDVFDRGDRVTEALWLIYHLEAEAKRAGGRVHYLIGNHEEMVLHGDNRYVNEKYLEGTAHKTRLPYQDLFGPETELGRWLRTKNAMARINGVLFVHGGISPEFCSRQLPVDSANALMRRYLAFSPVRAKFDPDAEFFLGVLGPVWYRGFFEEDSRGRYARLTQAQVAEVLECFGATAIAVGHTEQPHVAPLYNGLVYSLDVPIDELGGTEGLLWEDGAFWRVTVVGERKPLD